MFGKTKLDAADKLFSQYIRTRDGWTCQNCRKQYPPKSQGLHCSHYFGRGRENTRYDPLNCVALCYFCHMKIGHGDERDTYTELMARKFGEKNLKDLLVRANTYCRKDRKTALLYVKELMKTLPGTEEG